MYDAYLYNADLSYADLSEVDLTVIQYWDNATWTGAVYNSGTIFPDGMDPTAVGMIFQDSGACCVSSGCAQTTAAECTDLGGTWNEAGSCDDCVAPPETCDGDMNADGVVNIDDLLLLISYFGNTCP